jgi:predicted  nucleic acid-binding Zn-ribbon protein
LLKRLLFNRDGSVSVYLILIILPVFLFHAVLIDFIRMKLAEREMESAVKAGVRSVLSEYDVPLRSYGLFGRKLDSAEMAKLFSDVVAENLSGSGGEGRFRYADSTLSKDSAKVQGMYSLANHNVFNRQILEDMKYRAPVEFGMEIAEKFKKNGLAQSLKDTSDVFDNAAMLERKWDEVNKELDESWDQAQRLCRDAMEFQTRYKSRLEELHDLADKIGLNTVAQVKDSIVQIDRDIKSLEEQASGLRSSLADAETSLDELVKSAEENAARIAEINARISSLESSISTIGSGIQDLTKKKQTAKEILDALLKYAALLETSKLEIRGDVQGLRDVYTQLETHLDAARKANTELREEKERLLSASSGTANANKQAIYKSVPVLDDAFFSEYKTESGKIVALANGLAERWASSGLITGDVYDGLSQTAGELATQIQTFKSKQEPKETARKEQRKQLQDRKDEQKQAVEGVLGKVNKVLGGCGAWGSEDSFTAAYRKLNGGEGSGQPGLYPKYYRLNSEDPVVIGTEGTTVEGQAQASMKQALSLGKRLGAFTEALRNELFVDEYVLTRFNNRTSQPAEFLGHTLSGQEAEYVLYGFGSCAANNSAAYGEVFLLFFSIRMMEELADPKNEALNAGSPLLVMLVAGAKAAGKAYADTNNVIDGKEVPLLRKVEAIKVNYKDLLRLFLLLHSNDKRTMARMQALIELNTGLDLSQETVYVQARAEASLRLWFVPRLMKLGEGWLPGKVRNGRFYLTKSAVMDY